jgi:hypothetical protein
LVGDGGCFAALQWSSLRCWCFSSRRHRLGGRWVCCCYDAVVLVVLVLLLTGASAWLTSGDCYYGAVVLVALVLLLAETSD